MKIIDIVGWIPDIMDMFDSTAPTEWIWDKRIRKVAKIIHDGVEKVRILLHDPINWLR